MNNVSQNGFPVLSPSETALWNVPVKSGAPVRIRLQPGHAGFILVHNALWFHQTIEKLNAQPQLDDWGYAVRNIRGSDTEISNHSSGTATDLNATLHPLAKRDTFTSEQTKLIRKRLKFYKVLRWGGDYKIRADEMHWEINDTPRNVRIRARFLRMTPRGRRILKANPFYPPKK